MKIIYQMMNIKSQRTINKEVAKTSKTDPLRIDSMGVPRYTGLIGMTLCPGKWQINALSGTWKRDLNVDMEAIKKFNTVALVTLMQAEELEAFHVGVEALRNKTAVLGIEWYHLPIIDKSTPDTTFEKKWIESGKKLREHLKRGGNIVLHCLGGLGRTGLLAARLLVEFGEDPDKAIQKVRGARPGTIETESQEEYVRCCIQIHEDW